MTDEQYAFDMPEGGSQGLDILDYCFNTTTQTFLQNSGLKQGMQVLEIGCGSGVMSTWIAQQIGPNGHLIAIDNNTEQLKAAQKYADRLGLSNIDFHEWDVNCIEAIGQSFDLIYCRFVLHHLIKPRSALESFYNLLRSGGIVACEEGIVNNGFSYPYNQAFGNERFNIIDYHANWEGTERDPNFGIKLYHSLHQQGFHNLTTQLIAPLLTTYQEKQLLKPGILEFKRNYLEQGHTEQNWQNLLDDLEQLIANDSAIVAFYQSMQVSGIK